MFVYTIQRYTLSILDVFFLGRYNDYGIIIVNFCTTPGTARIYCTISQLPFSLALRAKIRIAPLAVQYLPKIPPATPGTTIVVFNHRSILPPRDVNN